MTRRKKATTPVDTSEFIGIIRRYLHENGLRQVELAERAEINEDTLSRLLSDNTRRPEPEVVVALADAMGKRQWDVAVAAGYPFTSPDAPSQEAERLLRLMDEDVELRDALLAHYREVDPGKRESLLAMMEAMQTVSRKKRHRQRQ